LNKKSSSHSEERRCAEPTKKRHALSSYVPPKQRVPPNSPLLPIRKLANETLAELHVSTDRPSIRARR